MRSAGRSLGLLAALVALAGGAGCAPGPEAKVPVALLAQAGAHVYHRPAPEILDAVRAELVAEGYTVEPGSTDGLLRTGWKMLIDGREFATFRDRYVVYVKRLSPHHCRVEAVRVTLSTLGVDTGHPLKMLVPAGVNSKTNSTSIFGEGPVRPAVPRGVARDFAFEWRLLARVEPDRAQRLAAAPRR
jgi:hypothetical protein